jgi:hypothetical protein
MNQNGSVTEHMEQFKKLRSRILLEGRQISERDFIDSCATLFRALRRLECTFRRFLVIVSTCRFRWAQAPTVNYPGLLTSRHL